MGLLRSLATSLLIAAAMMANAASTLAATPNFTENFDPVTTVFSGSGGANVVTPVGTGGALGGSDGYIRISRTTTGNLGAQTLDAKFTGSNVLGDGVGGYSFFLQDTSGFNSSVRVALGTGSTNLWVSNPAFPPPNGSWGFFSVSVTSSAGWTRVSVGGTFADARNAGRLTFRHNPSTVVDPANVIGEFGLDELRAIPNCGDGMIVAGEVCDDNDAFSGDGCSSTCQVESTWVCTGEPSSCIQDPIITLSTASLNQVVVQDGATSTSFTVRNSGGQTLSYTVTDNVSWLSVAPGNGTSTGETDSIVVDIDAAGLSPGSFNGTITVTDPGAFVTSQQVSVSLTVNRAGVIRVGYVVPDGGALAATTLVATVRGAYREDTGGFGTGGSGTATGNYLTGGFSNTEERSFFVFDLSGVTDPIISAQFQINVVDYSSIDPTENFSLVDFSGSIPSLVDGTGGGAAFDDLGTGATYGSDVFSEAIQNTVRTINMSAAALADMNAAAGGNFAVGGVITSISAAGGTQFAFGGSLGAGSITNLLINTRAVDTSPEATILAANYEPLALESLNGADLSGIDVLWVLNRNNSVHPPELIANQAAVSDFVQQGGVFLYHDRLATSANLVLPGGGGISFTRDLAVATDVEVADDSTTLTRGPGGDVTSTNHDAIPNASHGYAEVMTLPAGAVPILSRPTTNQITDFTFPFGNGFVHYSSSPLDFHLLQSPPTVWAAIYAVNAVSYAAQLALPIDFIHDPGVGGFVPDTASPEFLAAIGGSPDTFVSFAEDRFGMTVSAASESGDVFSDDVVFSTGQSADPLLPPSDLVAVGNPGLVSAEIGPNPSFTGLLEISFLKGGRRATAVGFGGVLLNRDTRVRAFDQEDRFLFETRGVSDNSFDFFGLVPQAGSGIQIGRIEIERTSGFAIQDMQADLATDSLLYFSEDTGLTTTGFWALDPNTGASTDLGNVGTVTGFDSSGLAPNDLPRSLFGSKGSQLSSIDPIGATSALGGNGGSGLAYDQGSRRLFSAFARLFATSTTFRELNPDTGAVIATLASPGLSNFVDGLAFGRGGVFGLTDLGGGDPSTLLFYSLETASWSTIGGTGVPLVDGGLAYDPKRDVLYAKGSNDANLYEINPDTGLATIVGSTSIFGGGGLALVSIPICGDNILEGAEQCDDGNTFGGDCCSSTCSFESDGSVCSDSSLCTNGDTCDGAGTCQAGPPLACNDGAFCNGLESCNARSGCVAGTPPATDDGVFCTVDSCNETLDMVFNSPASGLCSNGMFCDGAEICDPMLDCQSGTPPATDDGVFCTVDSCNETLDMVFNSPASGLCNNALFCDGVETCNPVLDCQNGAPPVTNDGVSCTVDSCDEGNDVVVNTPNNGFCNNGLFCDGSETCDASLDCVAGAPPISDDGVSCTVDSCDEGNDIVVNTPSDGLCNNGQFCDGSETCNATLDCQAGTSPASDDGVGCTDDSCDESNDVIVNAPNAGNCSNGLFCDGSETCDAALDCQAGAAPTTDDGVGCTTDTCDELQDVVTNLPNDSACSNGLFCDGSEICDETLDCQSGTSPVATDGVACTTDACDELLDVVTHTTSDAFCGNGLFCDGSETCDATLDCQGGIPPDPNDGVSCTVDSCDEAGDAIVNAPNAAACGNGVFCDGDEVCDTSLGCLAGLPRVVDDGIGCTSDSCDEVMGLVVNAPSSSACDDGLFCNGDESCDVMLGCQAGTMVMDDGVDCTDDVCDEVLDSILSIPNDSLCDNAVFCDGAEFCSPLRGCRPGTRPAALVSEDFELYAPQVDPVGTFVAGTGETLQRVTAGPDTVATVFAASAGAAGIEEDAGGNRYWTVDATSAGLFVAEGTIPPEVATALPSSGPLADYFAQPVNLTGAGSFVCVDVRDAGSVRATTARIVLGDADGNFAAGPSSPSLDSEFRTQQLEVGVDALALLGGAAGIDLTRIETVGVELSSSAGASAGFSVDIDEVRLIPEPSVLLQGIAAVWALAAVRRRRRR